MAVYTELTDDFIRYMLAIYPDAGELRAAFGISAGSTNTSYRLETTMGEFYLRVNENKRFADLVYEKNLLRHLAVKTTGVAPVAFPEMLKNAAGGYFFPVETSHGRKEVKFACIFRGLRGRELAPFEVTADQVNELGQVLARLHMGLRDFRGGRSNPFGVRRMRAWLAERPPSRNPTVLDRLQVAFRDVIRRRRALPRGVIHGDLFANNTKWHRGRLHAVFDWEMAGRDHLLLDLAIVLNAWCWQRLSNTAGGAFDPYRLRSLVEGYQSVRPLSASERRGIYVECRLAALRFAISRHRDFGEAPDTMASVVRLATEAEADSQLSPAAEASPQRDFLDYREYWARHEAWRELGRRGTCHLLGLEAPAPIATRGRLVSGPRFGASSRSEQLSP